LDAPLTVSIRKASPDDSRAVAALHLAEIPWGLLTSMGPRFVEAFYKTLLGSDLGFAYLAEREGRPIGYVTGVVHWRKFYRAFLRRNLLMAARVVMRRLFDVSRWRRLLETTRYATSSAVSDAELLSIALRPEARGTGASNGLVRALLDEFARRGVRRVRVTTASDNVAAARVYERTGFELVGEEEIHPGERAKVYVITVPVAAGASPSA
jgi:ribosomal protein S18 acetylase RimI-like enzyme